MQKLALDVFVGALLLACLLLSWASAPELLAVIITIGLIAAAFDIWGRP